MRIPACGGQTLTAEDGDVKSPLQGKSAGLKTRHYKGEDAALKRRRYISFSQKREEKADPLDRFANLEEDGGGDVEAFAETRDVSFVEEAFFVQDPMLTRWASVCHA